MEQSPSWEVNRSSPIQEIPCIVWNTKFYFRIRKSPLLFCIPNLINPVHAPHATSWRSVLILSSHLRVGSRSVTLSIPNVVNMCSKWTLLAQRFQLANNVHELSVLLVFSYFGSVNGCCCRTSGFCKTYGSSSVLLASNTGWLVYDISERMGQEGMVP